MTDSNIDAAIPFPQHDRPDRDDREDPYASLGGGRYTYNREGRLPVPAERLPNRALHGRAATKASIRREDGESHSSILPSPKTLRGTPPEQLKHNVERLRAIRAGLTAIPIVGQAGLEIEPVEQPLAQPQQPELPLE